MKNKIWRCFFKQKQGKVLLGVGLVALIATTNVFANNTGYYLGASGGWAQTDFSLKAFNTISNNSATHSASASQFLASVLGGYGYSYNIFYLGAELATDFPNSSGGLRRRGVLLTDEIFTDRFSAQSYMTFDLTPGIAPNQNWRFYAIAGTAYAHLTFKQLPTSLSAETTNAANNWGYRLGAGTDYEVSPHWTVGIDYVHTDYGKLKATSAMQTRFSISPITQEVVLHAHYNFA